MVYVDNKVALRQLEHASKELLSRTSWHQYEERSLAKDGQFHARILALVRIFLLTETSQSPGTSQAVAAYLRQAMMLSAPWLDCEPNSFCSEI